MKVFVFLLSIVTAIGSFLTFGREYETAYFSRSPSMTIFSTLAYSGDDIRLPLSSRGMRELFAVCADIQLGFLYQFQTPEVQRAIDARCTSVANNALAHNPTYSAAHTIAMFSAQDAEKIAQSLILSQITAPTEAWNAKLRLIKALSLYGMGNAALDSALRSDITLLVQSRGGRVWLAGLYKRQVAARPILIAVIEQRPFREKSSFLSEVRKLG